MKYFLTALGITFFFSGCTTRDAFSSLNNLSLEQTRAIEQTQSGKIMNKNETEGIYGAVYLNVADKKNFRVEHAFYISIYLKNNNDLNITMNGQKALDIQQLSSINKYADLLPTQTTWATHYIASFEDKQSKKLTLKIDSGQFSSGPLMYLRD